MPDTPAIATRSSYPAPHLADIASSSVPVPILCRSVRTWREVEALEADWRALFSDLAYPSPFCSWEWMSNWWRHFGGLLPNAQRPAKLNVVVATSESGRVLGIAPFFIERSATGIGYPRRMRLFGIVGNREYMTEEPPLLLRRGHEKAAISAIMRYVLSRRSQMEWDMLDMRSISVADDPLISPKSFTREFNGRMLDYVAYDGPQMVHLPETWQAYRSQLSKSMRDNLSYYPRRLDKHGRTWRIHSVRDPKEMPSAAAQLHRLHTLRASSQRGQFHYNHMPGSDRLHFLRQVMSDFAAQEMATIALLEVDGKIVAAEAFLEHDRVLTVYYSGFDPEYYEYSPMLILEAQVIRDALTRGVRTVNYLTDKALWKERWNAESHLVLEDLTCSSRTPMGLTLAVGRRMYRKAIGYNVAQAK